MAKKPEKQLRKIDVIVWAERAAEGKTHAERMKWIEENVPETHRSLVRDIAVDFTALRIFELPTKEARRAALEDIPLDADPAWTKDLVALRVKTLWKERKRA